jgi:pyridoxamine 5'-phosphate oxidase
MNSGPFELFERWFAEACASEPALPEAMALATADAQGRPSVRMVLLKGHGPGGFTFFTNLESRKGDELAANPNAALLFYWKSLRRQVRIEGPVERVTDDAADEYFATRARDSQVGAWASDQSRALESLDVLDERFRELVGRFDGGPVPRPPHWSGFVLRPVLMEFWSERPHRLHERRQYRLDAEQWTERMLYP